MLAGVNSSSSAIYNVNLDGANIDLIGTIETNILGTFTLDQFHASLTGFDFTASNNGANPYQFTDAGSTFGLGSRGNRVSVTVTVSEILFSTTNANPVRSGQFLTANTRTNNVRENLLLTSTLLRYRQPSTSSTARVFDNVSDPLVFASVLPVPVPPPLALFLTGLVGLGIVSRRKKRSAN